MDVGMPMVRGIVALGLMLAGSLLSALLGVLLFTNAAFTSLDGMAGRLDELTAQARDEVTTVLGRAAEGRADCSDATLRSLRSMVFDSQHIKDIGVVRGGRLLCTTTTGVLEPPLEVERADFVTSDGLTLHLAQHVLASERRPSMVVGVGDFTAVLDPRMLEALLDRPKRAAMFLVDAQQRVVRYASGDPISLPVGWQMLEGREIRGGALRITRCGRVSDTCTLATLGVGAMLESNRGALIALGLLGAGGGFGVHLLLMAVFRRETSLERRLQRALRRGEVYMAYQPVVDLHSECTVAGEALARWRTPAGTEVSPDRFVRAAEDGGFVRELTHYIIHRVGEDVGDWLAARPDCGIAINISPADLTGGGLSVALTRALLDRGVKPSQIVLELTESATADRRLIASGIAPLRALGYRIYIDDFGTGYSSFSYLDRLDVDGLKIDRSFTRAIGTGSPKAGLVPRLVEMAESLQLQVVVEGLETEAQVMELRCRGHCLGQGWLYSAALPPAEFKARVEAEAVAGVGQRGLKRDRRSR